MDRTIAQLRVRAQRAWVKIRAVNWRAVGPLVGIIVGLDLFGRWSPHDGWDLVGVCLLAFFAVVYDRWAQHAPRERLVRLGARLRARFEIDVGVDLRGTPPLERALPRPWVELTLGLVAAMVLLGATRGWWPGEARRVLQSVSGLALLVVTGALWAGLVVGIVLMPFIACFFLRAHLIGHQARRAVRRRVLQGTSVGLAATICFGALRLDPIVPMLLAATGVAATVSVFLIPVRRTLTMAWRSSHGAEPVRYSGAFHVGGQALMFLSTYIALGLAAVGDRILGGTPDPDTSVTAAVGRLYAWSAGLSTAGFFGGLACSYGVARWHDPDRRVATSVHVDGAVDARTLRGRLSNQGLDLRRGMARPFDVRLKIVAAAPERDPFAESSWPLELTEEEAGDGTFLHAIQRRDELQRRRELLRGLRWLLEFAGRAKYENGTGYWIAPHLWYLAHMTRDTEEEDSVYVGPAYHRILSRAARGHFADVLDALEVDLVYLEDGVTVEQFERVLEFAFEHFDLFAASRPADERSFLGIPGVRVMIHACAFETSLVEIDYDEPDYEDLARARILHVFVDRGDDEDELAPPVADDSLRHGPRRLISV